MKTHWNLPSHFIGASECSFGMTDAVNGYIISTVGDYRFRGKRMEIGLDRFYETMVFRDSSRRCSVPGCTCGGIPEPTDWAEIDSDGYQTESEASIGHALMVEKYSLMNKKEAPTV